MILPDAALLVKVPFQSTAVVSPPLQATVPVPTWAAPTETTPVEIIIPAATTPVRSFWEKVCIFVLVKKLQCLSSLTQVFLFVKI